MGRRRAVRVGDWVEYTGATRKGWFGTVQAIRGTEHLDVHWLRRDGKLQTNYPTWASKVRVIEPSEEQIYRWSLAQLTA